MTSDKSKPLRVASYNIRAGLGSDLRRDPERVLQAIRALKADLVVLQEADFRLRHRPSALPHSVITDQTGLVPLPLADHPAGLGWHGIAVLARPEFDLGALHRINLPGLEPRGAVVADLFGNDLGIRLVGVHLGLLRSSRRAQLDHIRETVEALPERPTLILGDFNEWSRRKGLGRIARKYRVLTPHRTYPSRVPVAALDRIAHSSDLRVDLLPIPSQRHPHPSDHRPVLAEVAPVPVTGKTDQSVPG